MKKILIIVAHADDEVLGCGATIAKHKRQGAKVDLIIITDSAGSQDGKSIENRHSELERSNKILEIDSCKILNFKDNQLDSYPLLEIIKEVTIHLKEDAYDILYTHAHNDLNIDHRITNQVALTIFRPLPGGHETDIYTFDIPSSIEYQSSMQTRSSKNFFNIISENDFNKKISALQSYASELNEFPHPRSIKNIENQAMTEGSRCGVKLAESFYVERIISNKND